LATKKEAAVIPFRQMTRPAVTPVTIPVKGILPAQAAVALPTVPAIDLSGRLKIWFVAGRGRIGKTTLSRWVVETANERGGSPVVIAADPVNPTLRTFLDGVVEPPSSNYDETIAWLLDLIGQLADQGLEAVVDLGAGNTSLLGLLSNMPGLLDVLTSSGIEPVAVHVIGPDPHDLAPMIQMEISGFQPHATMVVFNEAHGPQSRFEQVLCQPEFTSVTKRGAVPIWMPQLTPQVARACDAECWPYRDMPAKAGPFHKSGVYHWLRRMDEAFAPVASWLPCPAAKSIA
jgi:hypothetical protein